MGEDGNVIKLKDKQLIRDVKHRWDSLYLMLERLEEMRKVGFPTSYVLAFVIHSLHRLWRCTVEWAWWIH